MTGTQATYSIASALSANTLIEVANIPDDGRELGALKSWLERRRDRFSTFFSSATAVVSLTNALPGDPLYRYAREANVRIVNIDAAIPWTYDTPGVALIDAPRSDVTWAQGSVEDLSPGTTAPFFWLSVSNTIRMADIVASDLIELFPGYSSSIAANLDQFKRSMLAMRRGYQNQLVESFDDTVFALTSDLVYMTNDLGLFVDGYFIKQDLNWTSEDLAAFTAHLQAREINVVIHKWLPSDAIVAAIESAGAQLVVLETGDTGRLANDVLAQDGLQQILTENLDKITMALTRGAAQ